MRKPKASKIFFCLILSLFGCSDPEERYDVGYDDGYAVGYNTTCKIRTTLIEGDFENENYSLGYNEGQIQGSRACRINQPNK